MDPLTIAAMFLTGAGTVSGYQAQQEVDQERLRMQELERHRQERLDQEAARVNNQSRERYADFGGQQAKTGKSLGEYFTHPQQGTPPAEPPQQSMPASASNITVSNENDQVGKAKAYTDQQGEALGGLRSFGELFGGINRDQARDAGKVGQIDGFKTGSAAILPLELDQANHAGDAWKLLSDITQGAGKVAMTAGLSGGKLPFMSKAPTVTPGAPLDLTPPNPGGVAAAPLSLAPGMMPQMPLPVTPGARRPGLPDWFTQNGYPYDQVAARGLRW